MTSGSDLCVHDCFQLMYIRCTIMQDVTRCITMPLTVAEIRLLHQATQYYGKQSGKWEQICKEHLPYRNPFFLAMLWSKHKNHKENDRESVP